MNATPTEPTPHTTRTVTHQPHPVRDLLPAALLADGDRVGMHEEIRRLDDAELVALGDLALELAGTVVEAGRARVALAAEREERWDRVPLWAVRGPR